MGKEGSDSFFVKLWHNLVSSKKHLKFEFSEEELWFYYVWMKGWIKEGRNEVVLYSLKEDNPPNKNWTDKKGHTLLWHAVNYYVENIQNNTRLSDKEKRAATKKQIAFVKALSTKYGFEWGEAEDENSALALVHKHSLESLFLQTNRIIGKKEMKIPNDLTDNSKIR